MALNLAWRRSRIVGCLVLCAVLFGCESDTVTEIHTTPTPDEAATATAQPDDTATPGQSPTGTDTEVPATRSPTPTALASATPTAVIIATVASATPGPLVIRGRVTDADGAPLAGAMVTAFDDDRHYSVTVVAGADGRYDFPLLARRVYNLRAQRIGWDEERRADVALFSRNISVDFSLSPTDDLNAQLPATYFYSQLEWPNQRVKGDFSRACANCHQIGDRVRWTRHTRAEWQVIVDRMIGYGGVPFFDEAREVLLDTIAETYSPDAPVPVFDVPPPISGDAARVVIHEWEIDPDEKPGCHDLEIGLDGTVYTVGGVYTLNPKTFERAKYSVGGGGHSIERDANGDMWITAPGPEQMIKLDVETKEFTRFDQARVGDDLGSYPHTLRFDDRDRIWYTLTRSNHVCLFEPAAEQPFTYYRLPEADPEISGVPIPVAYGCDVAPDQTVWWSQLFGHMIGRIDPDTGVVSSWRPPFDGPRRLRVGPDNVVWVPGYGAGVLGRFDPRDESWKVYDLPTTPAGTELPYSTAVNHDTGHVWVTGSNSDSMVRFDPDSEQWTVFQLPTPINFTREIEFGDDGSIWTCTSSQRSYADQPGSGRLIKLELREREGVCGDDVLQLGEQCDDGNSEDCDGCSATCVVEDGCGDGSLCAAEECDDGGVAGCDGCSPECVLEDGWQCGDGVLNEECREECDPPGDLCTDHCLRVPVCGDGRTEGEEECDDGNLLDCDGCSSACVLETGCGDGARCGAEECDDGNAVQCDGCSECVVEIGAACGDGVVNETCGEQCDPPSESCSPICTLGNDDLGTRPFTFGGEFFSSPLGTAVPLGELSGRIDLVAGNLSADGTAAIEVDGPVYYSSDILGGSFGFYCVRVDSCVGFVDCDGGSPVDVVVVQDSNGPGLNGLPVQITTGQGEPGPAGSVELSCTQTFVQLQPGEGSDCTTASYGPVETVVYTTGETEGFFINGAPKVGSGAIAGSGEPFDCANWQAEDGAGSLAGVFLVEDERQAGDVANTAILDD